MENIRSSKKMLLFANKITNLYEVLQEHYERLFQDNVTQTYKRASSDAKKEVRKESMHLPKISDLVIERYITLTNMHL